MISRSRAACRVRASHHAEKGGKPHHYNPTPHNRTSLSQRGRGNSPTWHFWLSGVRAPRSCGRFPGHRTPVAKTNTYACCASASANQVMERESIIFRGEVVMYGGTPRGNLRMCAIRSAPVEGLWLRSPHTASDLQRGGWVVSHNRQISSGRDRAWWYRLLGTAAERAELLSAGGAGRRIMRALHGEM